MNSGEHKNAEAFEQVYKRYADALDWKRRYDTKEKFADEPPMGLLVFFCASGMLMLVMSMRHFPERYITAVAYITTAIFIACCKNRTR